MNEREVVLVSNGPGELYTWARPVFDALRLRAPELPVRLSLIPCQFASGRESEIAATFGADTVTTPNQYLRTVPLGRVPEGLGATRGVVLQVGGAPQYAAALAERLGYPFHRYAFVAGGHHRLERLYLADEKTASKAHRLGTPKDRIEVVGNLVADALRATPPLADPGRPHLMMLPGSRDGFARPLIPLMLAIVDDLVERHPNARFVWPVSGTLSESALEDGIAGVEASVLGGIAGRRDGDRVITPRGAVVELIAEDARYAHMRAADLAVTIPGTNTLELGLAGLPSLVVLPMNAPELIPLEGAGHWLGLVPLIGRRLKRWAVRLAVDGFDQPVSLPNRIAGESIFEEVTGIVEAGDLANRVHVMLSDPDDLARRRARLASTMPPPGAAERIAERIVTRLDAQAP